MTVITATIKDQANNPISGATITAQLTKTDKDPALGFISPELLTFTTDLNGQAAMTLWPNTSGTYNTQYHFVVSYQDSVLINAFGTVPATDSNLRDILDLSDAPTIQPYPIQDSARDGRIIQDVLDLLQDDTDYASLSEDTATTRKIKRWLEHVLMDANTRGKWWFLENLASLTLNQGNDVIDLRGHADKVVAVYAPKQLNRTTLAHITELRQLAMENNYPNAGPPTHYALEAGRRIHLWPCPYQRTSFATLYTRPMHVATLPREWEVILLNGILGLFGQHFDRDALMDEPDKFELRYERQLKRVKTDGFDPIAIERFHDALPAFSSVSADSRTDTATQFLMPASLTGIGYVTIETGDYPLTVN